MGSLAFSLISLLWPLISRVFKSGDDAAAAKAQLMTWLISSEAAAEISDASAKAKVLIADATAPDKVTRLWRPITSLIFVGLVVLVYIAGFFKYTPLPEYMFGPLMDMVKFCLGAYIGGRSLEKAVNYFVNGQGDGN